jgi:hypothetical protein
MTREQTVALALLISRGAGNALDIQREGNSPQGLAQAALQYARACGWASGTEAADMRRALDRHSACRSLLTESAARIEALELALAAVLGAATAEPLHPDNLINTIIASGRILAGE